MDFFNDKVLRSMIIFALSAVGIFLSIVMGYHVALVIFLVATALSLVNVIRTVKEDWAQ